MTYKVAKSTNFVNSVANSSENQTVKPLSTIPPTTTGKKFYQLEHAAFLEMRSQLTPAEKDILLYLRTLDPFGDRNLNIGIRETARTLALNPSTVSRAIRVLNAKGYIAVENLSFSVRVRTLGVAPRKDVTSDPEDDYVRVTVQTNSIPPTDQETCGKPLSSQYETLESQNESVVSAQHHGSQCNTFDPDATPLILMQHLGVETQSEQALQTPKTSKTINTFKDQIDQEEYFNFEEAENTLKPLGLKWEKPIKKKPKTEIQESKELKLNKIDLETADKSDKTEVISNQENQKIDQPQAIKPKIDPDSDLKKFIINTVEAKKGVKLVRPNEYVAKCLQKDRQHWESLYQESLRPIHKRSEARLDFFPVEVSIMLALQFNDLEFAIGRFKNYPEMADRLFERHPEWREILTTDS
jgi:hypothetical protein